MSAKDTYPNLFNVIAGGFNQDWPITGGSVEGVIDFVRESFGEETVAAGLVEIDQAIEAWSELPESEISENIFDGLCCEYDYTRRGLTGIEFLKQVRGLLEA